MEPPRDDFQLLLEQAQAGSQDAFRLLIQRYAPHVLRVVRRRLSSAIRAKFDSVDFVQAVWASFFAASDRFDKFSRPEEMAAYLAAMAQHKVIDEVRRRLELAKHNVNRERSLTDSYLSIEDGLPSPHASPSQVAVAEDLWDRMLEGQPDHYRRILELRRAGHTQEEVAEQLGLNERTVRRVIERVLRERIQ